MQQCLYALVFEAQRGGSLSVDDAWALNGVKAVFADRAIVADSLDVE